MRRPRPASRIRRALAGRGAAGRPLPRLRGRPGAALPRARDARGDRPLLPRGPGRGLPARARCRRPRGPARGTRPARRRAARRRAP
ncbi:hypothetical protein PL81_11630, partial [Streptomyces sp. RSD-27]